MIYKLVLAFALAAIAPALAAQEVVPRPEPTPQDGDIVVKGEKDKRNRKVCERATPTGSLMSKVTCRTVAEREQARERDLVERERMTREKQARDLVQLRRGE